MQQAGRVGKAVVHSVLILDDDDRVAGSIARSLAFGRAVYTARDAATGLALARQHRPDLVIVDLRLGSENGLDVIRAIRSELPSALIAMISGYVSTEFARRHPADFSKPMNEMRDRVEAAIERDLRHRLSCFRQCKIGMRQTNIR